MSITTIQQMINNRPLTRFEPLANELTYSAQKNYLFDLDYLGALKLEGENALEFLQGQITCDVNKISSKQISQGALCNLKGRVMALLDVLNWNGLHLVLPNDLLLETQNSLSKPAMFSRVKINSSSSYKLFGLYLQNAQDIIPLNLALPNKHHELASDEQGCIYCLTENLYIVITRESNTEKVAEPFIKNAQWRGSLAWHVLQLQHKMTEIYPETRGLFLPHRLDLHETDYLDFQKGCYKGQEVIARMHYRAKLKHKMRIYTIQANQILKSGDKILSSEGDKEIGELIDFSPLADNNWLIAASMLIDAPEEGRINDELILLSPYA